VAYYPLKSSSGPVKLVIQANPTSYALGFAEVENETWNDVTWTGDVDASTISVPPTG
jgi:hypothetical protein